MSKFSEYIGSQFGNPHGIMGKIYYSIMNVINNMMYRNIVSDIKADKNSLRVNLRLFSSVVYEH
ncbi:MAG: hypothetical protein K2I06_13730 [Ruminococcus sp.]|nr:hypothetical protein [Ruminococcus sp.]